MPYLLPSLSLIPRTLAYHQFFYFAPLSVAPFSFAPVPFAPLFFDLIAAYLFRFCLRPYASLSSLPFPFGSKSSSIPSKIIFVLLIVLPSHCLCAVFFTWRLRMSTYDATTPIPSLACLSTYITEFFPFQHSCSRFSVFFLFVPLLALFCNYAELLYPLTLS
jgi:hypothetical protein